MQVEIVVDANDATSWRVEAIDVIGDGSCEVAIFSGPRAEDRAREFAKFYYDFA